MITSIDDYTNGDKVDWEAYHKAKQDNGDACYKCGSYILFSEGFRQMCGSCDKLHTDLDEIDDNPSGIRCPNCGRVSNDPIEFDIDIYEQGIHETKCFKCDYSYEIETHVKYSWSSPAMIDQNETLRSDVTTC